MKNATNVLKCWHVDKQEKYDALRERRLFCGLPHQLHTLEYFRIAHRIDSNFIEGFLGRTDQMEEFLDSVDANLSYLLDYKKREKTYFTFDRIALYEVIEILTERPLKVILKRLDNPRPVKKGQAFMIMPFHDAELDAFYFENIRPVLKADLDIEIYRADDFRSNDVVVETIYKLIEESEFIIADTTIANKNSFYELGYSAATGKEIITIQNRNIEQILFFDRAHIRSIFYGHSDVAAFQSELKATIFSIRTRAL